MCDIPNSKGLDKNVWTFVKYALKMISRLTQQRLGGLASFCPFESRVNLRTVNLLKEEEEDATK